MRSFLGALLVLGLVGCGGSTTTSDASVARDSGGGPIPGQAAATVMCGSCHGSDLSGGPAIGACTPRSLRGLMAGGWTSAQIVTAARTGANREGGMLCAAMPRFTAAQIPDATLNDIASYLLSLTPSR